MKIELKKIACSITEANKKIGSNRNINIMEVCGTHTMSIARYGIHQLLPSNINLISGPGCPVCVTSVYDIDWLLEIINEEDIVAFSFGDLFRVPGTNSSLELERTKGKRIHLCYSPLEALEYALNNRSRKVMFIAIGFETTAPLTSVIIKRAYEKETRNFFVFSTHKVIPPALKTLLDDKDVKIDGLLLPGHVSAITGTEPFKFIPDKYNVPCIVTGFEAFDVMQAILSILIQLQNRDTAIEIEYKRVVKPEGNPVALRHIAETFTAAAGSWRGIGAIAESGLELKDKYSHLDAKKKYPATNIQPEEPAGCICGAILKGIKKPTDCKLFSIACTPDDPVGPCMVSSEGTCAAYFKYRRSG